MPKPFWPPCVILITNECRAARSLHPGTATGAKLHVVRRKHDRFARTECCSAAGWDAQTSPSLRATSVRRTAPRPGRRAPAQRRRQGSMPRGIVRPVAAMDRSGLEPCNRPTPDALCVKDASKMCGLARYNVLKCTMSPPIRSLNVARSSVSSTKEDKPWSIET